MNREIVTAVLTTVVPSANHVMRTAPIAGLSTAARRTPMGRASQRDTAHGHHFQVNQVPDTGFHTPFSSLPTMIASFEVPNSNGVPARSFLIGDMSESALLTVSAVIGQ
ncbi:hypothetical protein [Streptomyces sp. NPDC052693]|uniref:hypothetical protein n=1 Tax=Streptomyces sp. NPDC052693 TaxID=3155814 RepID=UPI00342769C8